ncbi:MAG: protein-L-isoaspartate(D-aspartate) O-methyltransferase [Proteobacteria bacterium]|nr:protein-L-isoaspartate(D-aspartate) O-methyltransferase [Pseudomonadota bacterium]
MRTPHLQQAAIHGLGMTSQATRNKLVARLRAKGISDERVLQAIAKVPRHLYVDEALSSRAYEDTALPIGSGQTISQPYIVALMTAELLKNGIPEKVLEVGTGSGYQAAVLAQLVPTVFSVERIDKLLREARRKFHRTGQRNIYTRHADGRLGWPTQAPFDAIILTAAGTQLEEDLLDQLADGASLIAPLGDAGMQRLVKYTRTGDDYQREELCDVSFVPLLSGLS